MTVSKATDSSQVDKSTLPLVPENAVLKSTVKRVATAIILAAVSYAIVRYTLSKLNVKITHISQRCCATSISGTITTIYIRQTQPPAEPPKKDVESDDGSESSEGEGPFFDAPTGNDIDDLVESQANQDPQGEILIEVHQMILAMIESEINDENLNAAIEKLSEHSNPKGSMKSLLLQLWLATLKSDYELKRDFYAVGFAPEHLDGEIEERDEGNCALLSLVRAINFDRDPTILDRNDHDAAATALRSECVNYMRDNYQTDELLQIYLRESLKEHYEAAMGVPPNSNKDPLEALQNNHQCIYQSLLEDLDRASSEADKEAVRRGIEDLERSHRAEEERIAKLKEQLEQLKSGAQFDPQQVEVYFQEIAQAGKFVGHAEIYTISQIKNLHVIIYDAERPDRPYAVFNDREGAVEPWHMIFRNHNHYNSYYPEDTGAGVG